MKSNIILVGMSGAGKSTLGVLLARQTKKGFADTDLIIQNRENSGLQDIIDGRGVEYFMELEEKTLLSLSLENHVIATGGSAVYYPAAMERLKRGGVAVYLKVSCGALTHRLKNISSRGIVMRNGGSFEDVYNERLPLYESYADITVDCTGRSIDDCVADAEKKLKEHIMYFGW